MPVHPSRAIRLDLLVPRMGPLSLARVPLPGGTSVAYILEPLCVGPVEKVNGLLRSWDRFPLQLDAEQGLDIPTPAGTLGFFNTGGLLQITLPGAIAGVMEGWQRFQEGRLETVGQSIRGTFRVEPGLEAKVELGSFSLEIRAPAPALQGPAAGR